MDPEENVDKASAEKKANELHSEAMRLLEKNDGSAEPARLLGEAADQYDIAGKTKESLESKQKMFDYLKEINKGKKFEGDENGKDF